MLQREHSAILSTFIKLPIVIKIFVLPIFEKDKLNGCVDPDRLNKAVDLLFGLALGNNANNNPTIVLFI